MAQTPVFDAVAHDADLMVNRIIAGNLHGKADVPAHAPAGAGTVDHDYALVRTRAELNAVVSRLREAGRFALCVVRGTPSAMQAPIVGIAVSTADHWARYVPTGHGGADAGGDLLAFSRAGLVAAGVDRKPRGEEKASDHTPAWCELS